MEFKITSVVEPNVGYTGIEEHIKEYFAVGEIEINSMEDLLWLIKDVKAPIMFDGETIVIMNLGYPQVYEDAPIY